MTRRRFQLDPERSRVRIEGSSSVHPIRAGAKGLRGWVELDVADRRLGAEPALEGEVRIALDRLRSGNALVDRETRRRVDADRYPEIVGRATASTNVAHDEVALEGEIDFRGATVRVNGLLGVKLEGDEIHLRGTQTFDVRDWGLRLPRLGLLRVHPDVTVGIEAVGSSTPS